MYDKVSLCLRATYSLSIDEAYLELLHALLKEVGIEGPSLKPEYVSWGTSWEFNIFRGLNFKKFTESCIDEKFTCKASSIVLASMPKSFLFCKCRDSPSPKKNFWTFFSFRSFMGWKSANHTLRIMFVSAMKNRFILSLPPIPTNIENSVRGNHLRSAEWALYMYS